ncbi:Uncharacterized protein dnm_087820 [Desulfonema magnum]|uniref:Uncharacterized protein n=1 Tax=Desulfonema magnum TaxID=45655 RepID=A0A975BX15_9BACT|nr:Uncharacterized protein dnm_087820 [Desulfonema magnum]
MSLLCRKKPDFFLVPDSDEGRNLAFLLPHSVRYYKQHLASPVSE